MVTMLVHEVMSTSPVTTTPATGIAELLAEFDRHDFNAFPVIDGRGRLVGVVSKMDVLRAFLTGDQPARLADGTIASERVEALMTTDIASIGPEDELVLAGELMVGARLQSLPVVEWRDTGATVVGIVSRGDVLRGLRHRLVDSAGLEGPSP